MAIPNVIYMLDKERHLRWTIRARIEFEKTTKIMLAEFPKYATTENFMKVCYTILKQEDQDLTLEKVIDLVEEHSYFDEMVEKLYEAFEAAQPKNSGKPTEKNKE